MNNCEHNWRLYEEESVRCMICDDILDHPSELAQELMEIFEDLGTMHGLKEQYRHKLKAAEARIKELEGFLDWTEHDEEWDKTWRQILSEWRQER